MTAHSVRPKIVGRDREPFQGPSLNPRWGRAGRSVNVCGIGLEGTMSQQRRVKLFRNGGSQAVRIPMEFELPGDEAIMHRDGERLMIEPVRKRGLVALLKSMQPLDETLPRDRGSRAGARDRDTISILITHRLRRRAAKIAAIAIVSTYSP